MTAHTFRTKPTGIHANFSVDCPCGGEITITNGRVNPHTCQPVQTVYAEDDDVEWGREFQADALAKLNAAFDSK